MIGVTAWLPLPRAPGPARRTDETRSLDDPPRIEDGPEAPRRCGKTSFRAEGPRLPSNSWSEMASMALSCVPPLQEARRKQECSSYTGAEGLLPRQALQHLRDGVDYATTLMGSGSH